MQEGYKCAVTPRQKAEIDICLNCRKPECKTGRCDRFHSNGYEYYYRKLGRDVPRKADKKH